MPTMGKTGDRVNEPGVYKNKYGKKINLNTGESFPPCPKEGKPITWEKIE
jgi:hypothetical protein